LDISGRIWSISLIPSDHLPTDRYLLLSSLFDSIYFNSIPVLRLWRILILGYRDRNDDSAQLHQPAHMGYGWTGWVRQLNFGVRAPHDSGDRSFRSLLRRVLPKR
jgi:hypothetical protein